MDRRPCCPCPCSWTDVFLVLVLVVLVLVHGQMSLLRLKVVIFSAICTEVAAIVEIGI